MYELCIKCDTRHNLQPLENGNYICEDCYMKLLEVKMVVNKWKDYSGDTVVLYNDYLKVVESDRLKEE